MTRPIIVLLGGTACLAFAPLATPQERLWLDPAWSDSVPAGEIPRVTLWFDRQLLDGGDAYQRATVRYAAADRLQLRADIVRQLKALHATSLRRARRVLDQLTQQGAIANCRGHWIVNSVTCDLPGANPTVLSAVPGAFRAYRAAGRAAGPPPARTSATRACTPDDGYVPDTSHAPWNARMLGVERVWATFGLTGRGVLHVIHDFGWSFAAEPVTRTLWCNPREIAGNGRDDDGNGFVDDVHGFNFDRGDADLSGAPAPGGGLTHGDLTAAALAGREARDTALIIGMAPNSRWAAVLSSLSIEPGVEWAIEQGADIYSMSFSVPNLRELRGHWRRVMEHSALAGLFLVSGAGNFANPASPVYAAPPVQMRIPEDVPLAVFGVSGVGRDMQRPNFSSQGPVDWNTVDYREGTVPKPDFATINFHLTLVDAAGNASYRGSSGWAGNSFAGPHTAGVLALMLEADPSLTPWRARDILVRTARDLGEPGFDMQHGAGLVDAFAAVEAVRSARRDRRPSRSR